MVLVAQPNYALYQKVFKAYMTVFNVEYQKQNVFFIVSMKEVNKHTF